jgi:membrane protein implicated in regulation of membrane protease activity
MLNGIFEIHDALDAILLGAFFFGLVMSTLTLIIGAADIGVGHVGHVGHAGHVHPGGHDGEHVGPLSIMTVLAFLTWFGGAGYFFRNGVAWSIWSSLLGAVVLGLVGGALIYKLLTVVRSGERVLDPEKERIVGSLGRITSSIRDGGTGEITYELRGVRQVSAARSDSGKAIGRGDEVVVLRYERGVAIVAPFSQLVAEPLNELDAAATRESVVN